MGEHEMSDGDKQGMEIARRVLEAAQTRLDSRNIGDPDALAKGVEWLAKWADVELNSDETDALTKFRDSGEDPEYGLQSYIDGDAKFLGNPDDPRVVDAREWMLESLAALLLAPSGKPPENYMMYQWEITPARSFDTWRIVGEIIRPGGKSSHEIREILEACLAAAGLPDGTPGS